MSGPEKKLVKSKSGLKILPIKDYERSPFELSEPEWVKDNECPNCIGCQSKFDLIRRKHHCRRCGQIYCNACCKNKLSLPRMCFLDPVRLCLDCKKVTLKENDFYENDLKILTTGVPLQVANMPQTEFLLRHCSLSADHCTLVISGEPSLSIPIVSIIQDDCNKEDEKQNIKSFNSLSFAIQGKEDFVSLKVPLDENPSASIFLQSLNRAIQMAEEAKSVIGIGR